MKSKLFQKLAALTGINLFNWKDKIAHMEVRVLEPTTDPDRMYRQNYVYFKRIHAQARLIDVMRSLIDSFDFEVEKWDMIQAKHEQELADMRSTVTKPYVLDLERQNKSLREKNEGQRKQIISLEHSIAQAKKSVKTETKIVKQPSSEHDKSEIIKLKRDLEECEKRLKVQHRLNELLVKQNK